MTFRHNIGIVAHGLHLPTEFETKDQVATRAGLSTVDVAALGIEKKCHPGQDDQPVAMALKAARAAFDRADGLRPEDVDVVLWTGEEYKDYIAQTAAIRLQEEMGCREAYAFDLVGQGVTSIVGLRVARDLMVGDETINTVLLAGGTRNVDLVDYTRPDTRFLLASSASGGALILQRNAGKNLLKDLAFHVDADMADEVYVPGGGTEHPFAEDNLNTAMMYYQTASPDVMAAYLKNMWSRRLIEVTQKVAGGHPPNYLALRHLNPNDRAQVLKEMGLRPEQSASLHEFGHHGPNDVILSLDLGLKTGRIRDGSVVVLTAGGIGFTYGAAAIEWGPAA